MESARLVFVVIFCVSLYMIGERWVEQYGPKKAEPSATATAAADAVPTPTAPVGSAAPAASTPASATALPPAGATAVAATESKEELITVQTPLVKADISTIGGELRRLELLQQRDTLDASRNFVLLDRSAKRTYLGQTGILGAGMPTHKAPFALAGAPATDAKGNVTVDLVAQGLPDGVEVHKRLHFRADQYVVDVSYEIKGLKAESAPSAYFQMTRDETPPEGDSRWVPTFNGVAVFTEKDKYQKVAFSDIAKGKTSHATKAADGWIGMVQHYFLSAWLPAAQTQREFYTRSLGDGLFAAGVILPLTASGDGAWTITVPLYAGPQEQTKLEALAPGLQFAVDYGWLTVIATPLFWALSSIHQWVVQNWGVAIIILTVLIKLFFFPLSAASYKSMAKMRVMGPKLQKLKEQFGDDRQKLHQAMMELYKTEKINPLGGCLPIVVQIPVFIALYWVLLGSVEMRHAPFALWIKDLSAPDPFYVLPVLMGISMIVQTRLNPEPPDPIQAKVMKIMPVAFSIFFFFFPAGLVLYWLVNNILSITQQWYITRKLEAGASAARKR